MSDADNTPPFLGAELWNYFLENSAMGNLTTSLMIGFLNCFWLNDNGEMMAKWFELGKWEVLPIWDKAKTA